MTEIESFEIILVPGDQEKSSPPSLRVTVKLDNMPNYTIIRQWQPAKPWETQLDGFWRIARSTLTEAMRRDNEYATGGTA